MDNSAKINNQLESVKSNYSDVSQLVNYLGILMMAAVQRRTGPYNVGYFGLLQSMDDGLRISYLILILGNIKDRTLIFTAMVNVFIVVGLFL